MTAGTYAIAIAPPGPSDSLRGQLDLGCRNDRLWGRLLFTLADTVTMALGEHERRADTIYFRTFGAATEVRLVVNGTAAGGTMQTGGRFVPFSARRTTTVAPAWLAAHAALAPFVGPEVPPDSAHSYPVSIGPDSLIFSRHGATLAHQRLFIAVRTNGTWHTQSLFEPRNATESSRGPTLAPDRRSIWFASTRIDSAQRLQSATMRLWTLRIGSREPAWSRLGAAARGGGDEQPSATRDGTVYFTSGRPGGLGQRDVWRVRTPIDSATIPEPLPAPINGRGDEHGVWVSVDHRMMILSSAGPRVGRVGGDDLYVSTHTSAGWSEPVPLPVPVNSFGNEYGASLGPDGRTLWFTSDRSGRPAIYAVDLAQYGVRIP